ncbi:MAG: hypothetical protein M5R40_09190 [Anaerolineae bacterium]|nr:hypothetical protein [Anaerolineae bacterium]
MGCNLISQQAPTPTVTLIPGSPLPGVTELVLPTATPGPSATPLGGQFAPTATLEPTPTQIPLPTVLPPTELARNRDAHARPQHRPARHHAD